MASQDNAFGDWLSGQGLRETNTTASASAILDYIPMVARLVDVLEVREGENQRRRYIYRET